MRKVDKLFCRKIILLGVPLMLMLHFSPAAYADAGKKTNIYVTGPKLNMFNTVIEASARASMNTNEGLAVFALQKNKYVRYDPVKYECRLLRWRDTANPKSIIDKSQKGGFKGITSADIEFTGVLPASEHGICEFDEAKIIGKYAQASTTTNQPVTPSNRYGSRHFDSMIVSVFKFKKSNLEMCIDKFGVEQGKSVCKMSAPQDTAPSIVFQISHEEKNKIGLRSASNRKTGYWKEGFTPENAESLSRGKKVKLINVNMHHDRGEVYFESLTVL